jgi:hypothetical protein
MLRSASVITPAIRFVSRRMLRWTVLIRPLSIPVSPPSPRMPTRNTGTSAQLFVIAYQTRNPIPTSDEKRMLMNALMNRSVSVRTLWRIESVSPLRCVMNSWYDSRSVWRMPSLKICIPNFWTT